MNDNLTEFKTNLRRAVAEDNVDAVEALLRATAIDKTATWFESLVIACITTGSWAMACTLLHFDRRKLRPDCADIGAPAHYRERALADAAQCCTLRVVKAILDAGVDASVVHDAEHWPLRNAAARLDHLLANDELTVNGTNFSWLMSAYGSKYELYRCSPQNQRPDEGRAIVRELLERGASPSVTPGGKSELIFTPLLFACRNANVDMVRDLLAFGADPKEGVQEPIGDQERNGVNVVYRTIAPIECIWDCLWTCDFLIEDYGRILALLHERGVNCMPRSSHFRSQELPAATLARLGARLPHEFPPFLAQCHRFFDTLFLGIVLHKFSFANVDDYTPSSSAFRQRPTVVRSLLQHGADTFVPPFFLNNQTSMLVCAISDECFEEVQCLLAFGYNPGELWHEDLPKETPESVPMREVFFTLRWLVQKRTSLLFALRIARKITQCTRQFSLVDAYVLAYIVGEVWCSEYPLLLEESISLQALRERHFRKQVGRPRVSYQHQWVLKWEEFVQIALVCVQKKTFDCIEEFLCEVCADLLK